MNTKLCPTCSAPIPANAPGGFCPACILRDADEPAPGGRLAPSLAEVSAAFPQLEVESLIGQGGMGFVYKVRQPSLDRTVALKILSPELSRDPAFAERFAREARVLGKLNHPNIVTVFEHGQTAPPPESGSQLSTKNSQPFFYLLMEYVDGVNLRQAMRAGRFTPQQALAVVPGICDALQAAHAQGVWHRDIKPENILLDAQGGVKIVDFGIARIVGDPDRDFTLTATGAALGSAAYMAPEQHEKPHDVDHRADIYSLGVVIYEMLTGELPLGRFPAPSRRAEVNARIDEIVLRTLEKERELRQQSAEEVKRDMTSVGAPSRAAAAMPLAPDSRFSRTAIVGAGSLALGFLSVFLSPFVDRAARDAGQATSAAPALFGAGLLYLFAAAVLGWIAVAQIRRSAGKLYGMGLAVFDGLLLPLLVLDALIIFIDLSGRTHITGRGVTPGVMMAEQHIPGSVMLLWLAVIIIVDFFIIRYVWRAVNGSSHTPAPKSPSDSSSEMPVSLQPTIILHAVLFALLAAVFFIVIPRFEEILRDMGVPRSYIPRVAIFPDVLGVLLFPVLFAIDVGLCFLVRKIGGRRGLRQWTVAVILVMVSVVAMATGALYLPLKSVIADFSGPTSAENARRAAKPVPQNLVSRTFAVGQLAPTQTVIEIVKTFVGQEGFLSCSLAPDPRYITVTATAEQVKAVAEFLVKRIGASVPYGRPMVVDQWTGQPETFNESVSGQTGSACFTYRGEAVGYVVYSKRPAKEFIRNGSLMMIRLDQGQVFEVALDGEDRLRVNRDFYNLNAGRAFAIDENGAVQQFPLYHTGADLDSLKRALLTRPGASVESWSYTLQHIDAARLDAQMKAKPEAGVATKVEGGVVTLTGRAEAVRPLATMLRMIDQPEVKDPLQLPLLNMPPDFFARLAIRALMSGTEFQDSQFEPAFFETLKRENITAPQLARALSTHVLELEKATFVNTGTPFESIMKTPGASTYYHVTVPCADQPDKPLTLRIRRTTQTMGTKPDIAGLAPWLIEEAKTQSAEPFPKANKAKSQSVAEDAAQLAATKGRRWKSDALDLLARDGSALPRRVLVMEFDSAPSSEAANAPDVRVKLSIESAPADPPPTVLGVPLEVNVGLADPDFRDVRLTEKDGVRTIRITRVTTAVPGQSERTRQLREDHFSNTFDYELAADAFTLRGFPAEGGDWGVSAFTTPEREITFRLQK